MTRTTIDPVTRVGGHLRVELDIAEGFVKDAWCSGTVFRGLESILEYRDARDAWLVAQRTCGTCGSAHALASVQAVEGALGLAIPANARLLRNLLVGSMFVANHIVHFYLRQVPDWVDAESALTADAPATARLAASRSDWPGSTAADMATAKANLSQLGVVGGPGLLAHGYWRHPAYALDPEANLLVMAHYLQALDWQRTLHRIGILLGGKGPHPQTFLVGGMALAPEWTGPKRPAGEHPWGTGRVAPDALSAAGLTEMALLADQIASFVDRVLLPDVALLAERYGTWATQGVGVRNHLSFGAFAEDDGTNPAFLLPAGRVMDGDPTSAYGVDQEGIAETVAHAWYADPAGDDRALRRPADAETVARYAGPQPPFPTFEGFDRYSWIKAPRYFDDPMEVGPLARILVAQAVGTPTVASAIDGFSNGSGPVGALLSGTLGRTIARAIEAKVIADRMPGWLADLRANLAGDLAIVDLSKWESAAWPQQARGYALTESPGGTVGHWVSLEAHRISRYQVVDANTWNVSPRDDRGRRGALEQALVGTPIADRDRPLEALRTIHSFDPCPTCGVH